MAVGQTAGLCVVRTEGSAHLLLEPEFDHNYHYYYYYQYHNYHFISLIIITVIVYNSAQLAYLRNLIMMKALQLI